MWHACCLRLHMHFLALHYALFVSLHSMSNGGAALCLQAHWQPSAHLDAALTPCSALIIPAWTPDPLTIRAHQRTDNLPHLPCVLCPLGLARPTQGLRVYAVAAAAPPKAAVVKEAHGFKLTREQFVKEYDSTLLLYKHEKTGEKETCVWEGAGLSSGQRVHHGCWANILTAELVT